MTKESPGTVEKHTIFQIPMDQRHGTWHDLFTIWFGSNIMMLTIVTGALATAVFKLDFMALACPSLSAIWWVPSSWLCMPHKGRN